MKMKALRGMGQQKCTELMYDNVKQQDEIYVIDPESTFTEGLKKIAKILAQKKKLNLS
jgi:hypothetical protein